MIKKKSSDDKSVHLHILITPRQADVLNSKARKLGLTVSSLLRLMIDDRMPEK